MSTAVLISGHMRSFDRCLPTQQWHVFRKLDDPFFFVSCVDDEQAPTAYLLEGLYPGRVFVEVVAQPTLNIPGTMTVATSNLAESQKHPLARHAPYAVSSSLQAILRQLWHLERVYEFARITIVEKGIPEPRDYVRCRPDLWFHDCAIATLDPSPNTAILPWWSRCGGCNDRFGIMGRAAASYYFETYSKIGELLEAGCPLHPESLLSASLEADPVGVMNVLRTAFRALRLDGSTVPPVIYPGEQEAFMAATR